MRPISEVLRLAGQKRSQREISISTGLAKTTVNRYLRRAEAAGLSWPLPADLDEAVLEARMFRAGELRGEPKAGRPEPDWEVVHRELKSRRHHVTLQLLWMEHRERHPEGWGYTQFCVHYREWLGRQDPVMRLPHVAGEKMYVDFCGDTVAVIDPSSGEIWQAQVFVSVLGASGYLYAEAVRGQDSQSWLDVHVRTFEFYGGVPEVVVPDNLKAGVTDPCWYDPEVNPSYLDLARHYDVAVLPTRPRHPRDKAAGEVGVQVVERWVLAPLRHRRFFSLAEWNQAIGEQLKLVNGRAFRKLATSRRRLFEAMERQALRPLPTRRYEFASWKRAKVNVDYHVEHERGHLYSVPFKHVHQRADVRATANVVEVFVGGQRVASHQRSRRPGYITDPEHMPAAHRAHAGWTPSRLVSWGNSIGEPVGRLVEQILNSRPHPEHGYRACLGLRRLVSRYGAERVVAACERALAIKAVSYRSVDSILKNGLDRVVVEAKPEQPPVAHENVRGADYYRTVA
jgi:transposase